LFLNQLGDPTALVPGARLFDPLIFSRNGGFSVVPPLPPRFKVVNCVTFELFFTPKKKNTNSGIDVPPAFLEQLVDV